MGKTIPSWALIAIGLICLAIGMGAPFLLEVSASGEIKMIVISIISFVVGFVLLSWGIDETFCPEPLSKKGVKG